MRIQWSIVLLVSLAAPSCWAEGQALSGIGLQLAYGVSNGRTQDSTISDPSAINRYGAQSSLANVGVGYAYRFGGNFNLGSFLSHFNLAAYVGADLNRAKLGGFSNATSSYQLQLRNLKDVALEPGMLIGRTSLAYLKAGYWRGDLQFNYQASASPESGAHSVHGWAVGAGIRSQASRHVTVGVEAEQVKFSAVNVDFPIHELVLTEKPAQLRAAIVLGIVF